MGYSIYTLLVDIALMSFLLFIGQFLRSKIKWLQNHYIPCIDYCGFLRASAGAADPSCVSLER